MLLFDHHTTGGTKDIHTYTPMCYPLCRYYGKSQPFAPFTARRMDYLSSEQALADYSELVTTLKTELDADASPVIAFGGSYGGMLAAWWRVAYPHIVTGAIAGSAPVLDFEGDIEPAAVGSFAEIVTRDATAAGGSSDHCAVRGERVEGWMRREIGLDGWMDCDGHLRSCALSFTSPQNTHILCDLSSGQRARRLAHRLGHGPNASRPAGAR